MEPQYHYAALFYLFPQLGSLMLPAQLELDFNISTMSNRLWNDILLIMPAFVFSFCLRNGRAETARENTRLSTSNTTIILRSIDLAIATAEWMLRKETNEERKAGRMSWVIQSKDRESLCIMQLYCIYRNRRRGSSVWIGQN